METTRNVYFDNLKGFLILLVIIGHTLEPLIDKFLNLRALYIFIYLFHIPMFVFISGFFSHKKSNIGKFLLYFIIFEWVYRLLFWGLFNQNVLTNPTTPTWIMWFLSSLITWQILLRIIPEKWIFILPIVCLPVGVFSGVTSAIGTEWSLSRTLVFAPFFFAGHYARKNHLKITSSKEGAILGVGILLVTLYISFTLLHSIDAHWLYGKFGYEKLGVGLAIGAIIRSIFYGISIAMCCALLLITPSTKTFLAHFGKNSLNYYLGHGIILKTILALGVYNMFFPKS